MFLLLRLLLGPPLGTYQMDNPLNESIIEHHAIDLFKELGFAFPSDTFADHLGMIE